MSLNKWRLKMKLRERLQEIRLQSGMSPHNTALALFEDFQVVGAEELYSYLVEMERQIAQFEALRTHADVIIHRAESIKRLIQE
jgi:hypothetical protein